MLLHVISCCNCYYVLDPSLLPPVALFMQLLKQKGNIFYLSIVVVLVWTGLYKTISLVTVHHTACEFLWKAQTL